MKLHLFEAQKKKTGYATIYTWVVLGHKVFFRGVIFDKKTVTNTS